MPKRGKGKLIVIEGTDGSGKATQTKLLAEKLKKEGHDVKTIDFPQYGKPSARKVEDYLAGKFGKLEEVGPYEAAKFYAEDRKEAAPRMEKWIEGGFIIIANRYQQSNKCYASAKIKSKDEKQKFMEWIDDIEYNKNSIPRPDAVVFLHVPAEIAQGLMTARGNRKDIHETDLSYLKNTEKTYLEIAKKEGWIVIECARNGKILPIDEIHSLLWKKIKSIA